MTLGELIAGAGFDVSLLSRLGDDERPGLSDDPARVEISQLAYRSSGVSPGTLFFCVPGFSADGHDYAPEAVGAGAVALVCERSLGLGVPELVVESARAAMAPIAASFYRHPTAELELVGVTGTDGKTTTAFLIRHILEAAGRRTGLLGTVQSVIGGALEEVERTTPEAVDLQRSFRRMVDAGDSACVMEASSHALALQRADCVDWDCAVFTNLTLDHLDFHRTLDAYFDAKRRLFSAPGASPGSAVVNVDDEWGRRLAAELSGSPGAELVTFAVEQEADYRAADVKSGASGSSFSCTGPGGMVVEVRLPLPGLFNVYNALAALAAAASLGVELAQAAASLADAGQVPGRFEPLDEGQDFTVLVDYAHTPDSLANVLEAARELIDQEGRGRLLCVFGAGGDRDLEKRPMMGAVARRLSDHVIVTSDNPRSEDPGQIIAAIVEGAAKAGAGGADPALEVEPDRRGAIAGALRLAQTGDIVLIAGKGHERGQEFAGGRKVPFDDREVAREELRKLSKAPARPVA